MVILGGILLLIALISFLSYRNVKGKLGEILHTETSRIADVQERAEAVAEALGSGYSSDYTEIKGQMETDEILTSALGKRKCVYYRATVTREWEEEEWYKDDEGRERKRMRKGSDTLSSESQWVPFYVNDGSGRLLVDPEHADIDLEESVNRFEPEQGVRFSGNRISLGSFNVQISGSMGGHRGRHTLGYRFQESIFTPGGNLYLLGMVADRGGSLALVKPTEKGQRFIISHKTEEELVAQQETALKVTFWIAAVAGGLGTILALVGLVTGNI